jgi:cell filamentation protein
MSKPPTRYSTTGNPEAQYEPGSRRRVLRNLAGITSVKTMELAETWCLKDTYTEVEDRYARTHRFAETDIRDLHRLWLSRIYPWAGQYRTVDISKGEHRFAVPRLVPGLMAEFSDTVLKRYTPCKGMKPCALANALAEVHVELVLIHPFREGNGRSARLLADLMAQQAGWSWLSYQSIQDKGERQYLDAIKAGLDRNYAPMREIFSRILAASK